MTEEDKNNSSIKPSLTYILQAFITKESKIPANVSALVIELAAIGLKNYFDVPFIIDNEGKEAIDLISELANMIERREECELDYPAILQNLVLIRIILTYLKDERDLIGLYSPF
jgi:hypothetical protein